MENKEICLLCENYIFSKQKCSLDVCKFDDEHLRVYLTPIGQIVAAGEIALRMRTTGKTLQEVYEENEREIAERKNKNNKSEE